MEQYSTLTATFHREEDARAAARELEHSGVTVDKVTLEPESDHTVLRATVTSESAEALAGLLNGAGAVELNETDPDHRFTPPRPGPNREFAREGSQMADASLHDTELADDPLLPGESRLAKNKR